MKSSYVILDSIGRTISDLTIDFSNQIDMDIEIKSHPIILRIKGNVSPFLILRGEIHGCSIGSYKLEDKFIRILINQKDTIPLEEALRNFTVVAVLSNPLKKSGVIECEKAALYLEP